MTEDQTTHAHDTFSYGEHALEMSNDSLGRLNTVFLLGMYAAMVFVVLVVPFL